MKRRLMTPGPTQVPEESLLTLARQVSHHRTPEFQALFEDTTRGLKEIFQTTDGEVLLLAGSGTAAMEAAVVNAVPFGGKALCLVSGKFSERWARICEAFGIEVVEYAVPWGAPFDPRLVAQAVRDNRDIQAVFTTLCETSTGVGHDIRGISLAMDEIGFTPERPRPLLVVDGISAVGAVECRMDAWKIDLLCVGGQKALMGLAGLAIIGVSRTAWERMDGIAQQGAVRRAFYLDLLKYRRSAADRTTPFTPPKSLIEALAVNIRALQAEGIKRVWARTAHVARAARAGFEAMGFMPVTEHPSDAMSVYRMPEKVDAKKFLTHMENRFGVKFAGGQGPWSGQIFRMAHFGLIDEFDILGTVGAAELTLAALGHAVPTGIGVAAVIERMKTCWR